MSQLHELPCRPDAAPMRQMLDTLFKSASHGLVELGWTSPKAPHGLNGGKLFDLDDLEALVDHAVALNESPNRNVYISAGLRREDSARDRRGEDADVFAVAAIKADFDAPGALSAAETILSRAGCLPNLVVITGRHPHVRGQIWWVLDEPCEDLERVRTLERLLARWLGGDTAITNCSRVMRLAGSVAWPLKQGRRLELTETLSADIRTAAWSIDEFAVAVQKAQIEAPSSPTADILDFNTAERQPADLAEYIAAAMEPSAWHKNVLKAVAHMTRRGTPADIVLEVLPPLVVQAGYSLAETRADITTMINGAVRRGFVPDIAEPLGEPTATGTWPILDLEALADVEPPNWLVDQYLVSHGVSMLYAPPASFKSFISLDLALSVAHGVSWRGINVQPASVLYIAAEGKSGVYARVLAWAHHRGSSGLAQPFRVCPTAVNLLDPQQVASFNECLLGLVDPPKLIIVDTLARCCVGADENSAQDAGRIMSSAQQIADAIGGHVMLIHHAGKDADKGARGSSAFRGAVDTELRLKRDERMVWLHVDKHKDAEEPKPAAFDMVAIEGLHPKTGEILASLVPVAFDREVAMPAPKRTGKHEKRILEFLSTVIEASHQDIAQFMQIDGGTLRRALRTLVASKCILQDGERRSYYQLAPSANAPANTEETED